MNTVGVRGGRSALAQRPLLERTSPPPLLISPFGLGFVVKRCSRVLTDLANFPKGNMPSRRSNARQTASRHPPGGYPAMRESVRRPIRGSGIAFQLALVAGDGRLESRAERASRAPSWASPG